MILLLLGIFFSFSSALINLANIEHTFASKVEPQFAKIFFKEYGEYLSMLKSVNDSFPCQNYCKDLTQMNCRRFLFEMESSLETQSRKLRYLVNSSSLSEHRLLFCIIGGSDSIITGSHLDFFLSLLISKSFSTELAELRMRDVLTVFSRLRFIVLQKYKLGYMEHSNETLDVFNRTITLYSFLINPKAGKIFEALIPSLFH